MRELKTSELRHVAGGIKKGPGNGDDEPPVIVNGPGPGGGGTSPPPGGGGGGTVPPSHAGGGGIGGGGTVPPGYESIGGFGTPFASVTWGGNQQVTGADFGFSIGADKISAALSQQAAGLTSTYTLTSGETVGAALNWANGNFSESITGSGAYGSLHFGLAVNSSSPDQVKLSYDLTPGVSVGFSIDTSGATSESVAAHLYDNGGIHVTAGVVAGTGGTEKYIKFVDDNHPDQHFEVNVSHDMKSGWSAGIGIGFPF